MSNDAAARADKADIRELLERYFNAIDRHDWDDVAACFAEDAEATYSAGTAQESFRQSRRVICEQLQIAASVQERSNHTASSIRIWLHGTEAESTTFAVVNYLMKGQVMARGLRYDDKLVKRGDEWLIFRRRHLPLWQFENVAVPPRTPRPEKPA